MTGGRFRCLNDRGTFPLSCFCFRCDSVGDRGTFLLSYCVQFKEEQVVGSNKPPSYRLN